MCPNCVLNQASLQSGMYVAFGICGLFFIVGVLAMMWAFKNGEFENIEDVKFEMLDDEVDGVKAKQAKTVIDHLHTSTSSGS
jgi:nitrogen fixation-related uncharacterized protein